MISYMELSYILDVYLLRCFAQIVTMNSFEGLDYCVPDITIFYIFLQYISINYYS